MLDLTLNPDSLDGAKVSAVLNLCRAQTKLQVHNDPKRLRSKLIVGGEAIEGSDAIIHALMEATRGREEAAKIALRMQWMGTAANEIRPYAGMSTNH